MRRTVLLLTAAAWLGISPCFAAARQPLVLVRRIPLGAVHGRIDHMAIDVAGRRLFVAELGNDSVGVVDLARGAVRTIHGLREPQGLGYVPATATLYAANAGDGTVRLFTGAGLAPAGRIALGEDADDVHVVPPSGRVFVGYGSGGIAEIDPARHDVVRRIRLPVHPEGFQIGSARIYVNLPEAQKIIVIDRRTGRVVRMISPRSAAWNFPLALDPGRRGFVVGFRDPPRLVGYSRDGRRQAVVATCGDADDIYVDAKRHRIYVSCGEGYIDVFADKAARLTRIARIRTRRGARTSLFVPALDRLYLALRARGGRPAAIWVFRPVP